MKQTGILFIWIGFLASCTEKPVVENDTFQTFCNPVDISYRFCLDTPSRREAADPTIVRFKDKYYLFASKSGGYWYSDDLAKWTFIESNEIPTEEYAPTAIGIGDTLYFLASSTEKSTIYKTTDPMTGKWSVAREELDMPVWDPAFFQDDDERLYLFWGCSNMNPIYGVELNYENNFAFIGEPKELIYANPAEHGWEVPGDYNTIDRNPWIEGAWVNKHGGKYYLQYAGPGTEFKSYSDAVYTAESPLGAYTLAPNNPFSYKPGGFAAGAGHGSTFEDIYGNYWHIATATISVKHMFERRLVLFPTFFDEQGTLHTTTKFGDYPLIIPQEQIAGFEDLFPGWMLLSYGKKVDVPSAIDSLPASNMTDEDIRTYWSAERGDPDEFATIDLGQPYDVFAIQINFAEHNTDIYGRQNGLKYRYTLEYSNDNENWNMLIDQSNNDSDNSHPYFQLPEKINCRYLKIKNIEVPDGNFALSGFRVFGKGKGSLPAKIDEFETTRNPDDRRSIKLAWKKSDDAIGYNISYGVEEGKLYHDYLVYQDTSLVINSLDVNQPYYFSIESFNENGISESGLVVVVK